MGSERASFAAELARRRVDAGLSLADVASRAYIHRGYVHRVERGRRWPTEGVAQALDTALVADGALLATWKAAEATPIPTDPDEFDRFERALASPQRTDAAVVEHLTRVLAEQRRAEDTLGARRLRAVVHAQIQVIDELATDAREPVRRELLAVSSHYCQFAGRRTRCRDRVRAGRQGAPACADRAARSRCRARRD
jgi:transcriptional regulator with XRE-family HTH domain